MTNFSTRQRGRGLPAWLGMVLALAIIIVLTLMLRARVAMQEEPPPTTPLTVSTMTYSLQDTYRRKVSYLGLVISGRKAQLSFEIPGKIASLPHRQGSQVRAGELIATLDDATLRTRQDAASARLKQAQAELELARIKARRQKDLRETGAVSREAYDETRLRASALQAQVDAVQADLSSIVLDLEKTRLLAPYDGIIADHHVYEGAVINPGTPVVRLVEVAQLEAHVGVAARRTRDLEKGKAYTLNLGNGPLQATLLSVRPDVDPVTRSATAVFALPPDINALEGEPVSLEMDEQVSAGGGWLPLTALQEGQRGLWTVLVVVQDEAQSVVRREAVEVLQVEGDRVYVRGTLADGAAVVATGAHRVAPGSVVYPEPAA